jgi:N-carbamoyl-L-amino-acid hydrolase
MVANVGCIEYKPGAPNVVPGEAALTVEFRAPDESSLDQAGDRLAALSRRVAARERCTAQVDQLSRKPVVRFDEDMIRSIEGACRETRAPTGRLTSFAGHDASVLSSRVPTAMLFVPSANGISHSPAEYTPERLLVQGAQVLLDALIELGRTRHRHPKVTQ